MGLFTSPAYWLSLLGGLISAILYGVFVYGLCIPVLIGTTTKSYFGQKIGILDAYKEFGSAWGRMVGTFILLAILVMVALIWIVVPIAGWFTGLGLLVFLGSVVAQLIPAVIVNEKLSGMDAISRAWDLGRRRFWWLIGFVVIFVLFDQLAVSGPAQLINYLATTLLKQAGVFEYAETIAILIATLSASFVHLLILPIQLIAWTLVYFDLRVRTEGFDLAISTVSPSENVMTDIASIPASPRAPRWLTWDEVGKFVVITLVVGGIYALVIGALAFLGLGLNSLLN